MGDQVISLHPSSFAFLLLAGGLLLILLPNLSASWAERRHQKAIAARMERGTDAYFEELRSLQAYKPTVRKRIYEAFGGTLLAVAASELIDLNLPQLF